MEKQLPVGLSQVAGLPSGEIPERKLEDGGNPWPSDFQSASPSPTGLGKYILILYTRPLEILYFSHDKGACATQIEGAFALLIQ